MSESSPDEVLARRIAGIQGLYYVATGIWPLLHMRSFEAVTGCKADKWLVKTVGLLVASIGASLCVSARRGRVHAETQVLGCSSALALGVVDVYYPLRGRISKIYLADAVPEFGLAAAWLSLGGTRLEQVGNIDSHDDPTSASNGSEAGLEVTPWFP